MGKIKINLSSVLQGSLISIIVCFAVNPISCKITETGIDVISGDYVPPVLQKVEVIDDKSVKVSFSESIILNGFTITEHIEDVSNSSDHSKTEELSLALKTVTDFSNSIKAEFVYKNNNQEVEFLFDKNTIVGKTYNIFGVVEDAIGNSLTFCVPFIGFNSKVAKMIMTEVRSVSDSKNGFREFVEFLVIEEGNVAGVQIQIGGEESKSYTFPAIDVKKGDVIVYHPEKVGDGIADELIDDLTLCQHTDSNENARDLWGTSEKSVIGNNDDIIVLYDQVNDFIIDAVMFRKADTVTWTKNKQLAADFINDAGIYDSSDIENANYTKGGTAPVSASAKHTLQRLNTSDILQKIYNDEKVELPVKVDSESWQIVKGAFSPGVVE